jgi:hypothetical protein
MTTRGTIPGWVRQRRQALGGSVVSIIEALIAGILLFALVNSIEPNGTARSRDEQAVTQCPIENISVRREFPGQGGVKFWTPLPPGDSIKSFPGIDDIDYDLRGIFHTYWDTHGGLERNGYPLSELLSELNKDTGFYHTVQYLERVVLEYHPDSNPVVMVSLTGSYLLSLRYPDGVPNPRPNISQGSRYFPQTGKYLGGPFLEEWETLEEWEEIDNIDNDAQRIANYGLPITDEFLECSELDGGTYLVQYFERAIFELHPTENGKWVVKLAHIGREQFRLKYSDPSEPGSTTPQHCPKE